MKRVPPRFDDEDAKRLLEKDRAGHWFSEISGNTLLAVTRRFYETGRKTHENAKRRGLLGNKKLQAQLAEDREKQQAAAADIWSRNLDLSIRAVAGMVARECGGNAETIRKHIKPPEENH